MKTSIVVVSLTLAIFSLYFKNENTVRKVDVEKIGSTEAPKDQVKVLEVAKVREPGAVPGSKLASKEDVFQDLPTKTELVNQYKNQSISELNSLMSDLNEEVLSKDLIKKYNNQSISVDQLKELARISRVRFVLNFLIVEKELAAIKAKRRT